VTLDALEAFRAEGPEQIPHVLPYLAVEGKKNIDIQLEVLIGVIRFGSSHRMQDKL